MSLPVFLHPDLSLAEVGQPVGLDGAEGRHAVTVKRMGPGEHLVLIDGSGRRATATITDTQGKDTLAALVDDLAILPEPSPRVVVVQAAAKQSRRARVPAVRGPLTTRQLCQEIAGARALVLHEEAEVRLKDLSGLDSAGTIYLLVGPEGGIGAEELARLQDAGATAIKLGPEVLRTASASMVALASIGTLTSRW